MRQKNRKHYKYIFWFLVDLAITNAYVLSQSNPDTGVRNVKDFRTSLAKELIGTYASKKRVGRPSIGLPMTRFCQHHFPMRVTSKHLCHYCHNYKNRGKLLGTAKTANCIFATLAWMKVTASCYTTQDTLNGPPTMLIRKLKEEMVTKQLNYYVNKDLGRAGNIWRLKSTVKLTI